MTSPRDPADPDAPHGVRDRTKHALEELEDVLEADVDEAQAVAPLVDAAESVQRGWRARAGRWLPLVVIATLAITLVASGAYGELSLARLAEQHEALRAWVDAHPLVAALALGGALATLIASGLPGGVVLTIAAGLLFGTLFGGILAMVADVVGGTALYFAARAFFASGRPPPPIVAKIRAGFARHPVSFAFFVRFVPVFPFGAVCIALAWLGCRLPLFLVSTGLGALPGCWIYAAIGAGLATSIEEHRNVELSLIAEPRFAIPLLALAVLALIPVAMGLKRKPAA
jgi:uncharacterized membrane protein YdjX (TVP38/TMEM64 family)